MVKNLPAMPETWVQSLGWEDLLEEGVATHSSIPAWRIPMDREAWKAGPWGHKQSDMTERLSTAQHPSVRLYQFILPPSEYECPFPYFLLAFSVTVLLFIFANLAGKKICFFGSLSIVKEVEYHLCFHDICNFFSFFVDCFYIFCPYSCWDV